MEVTTLSKITLEVINNNAKSRVVISEKGIHIKADKIIIDGSK
jgi:hypothetical protein